MCLSIVGANATPKMKKPPGVAWRREGEEVMLKIIQKKLKGESLGECCLAV